MLFNHVRRQQAWTLKMVRMTKLEGGAKSFWPMTKRRCNIQYMYFFFFNLGIMMHTSFSWRDSRFCIWSCTQKETKIIVKGEKKKSAHYLTAGHLLDETSIIVGLLQKLLESYRNYWKASSQLLDAMWLSNWHDGWSIPRPIKVERVGHVAVWLQIVNRPLSHSDRPSVGTVFVLPLLGYCRYTVMQHHGLDQRGAAIHLNKSRYQTQSYILFSPMGIACLDHTPKKAF